ncbi:MAG: hypothetical protein M1829_006007 [Trizodia sp. TS-e1964]|nr:MAG: hypothetical protein M1829_006007 [Trizodia sp. TS-e1964]
MDRRCPNPFPNIVSIIDYERKAWDLDTMPMGSDGKRCPYQSELYPYLNRLNKAGTISTVASLLGAGGLVAHDDLIPMARDRWFPELPKSLAGSMQARYLTPKQATKVTPELAATLTEESAGRLAPEALAAMDLEALKKISQPAGEKLGKEALTELEMKFASRPAYWQSLLTLAKEGGEEAPAWLLDIVRRVAAQFL